MRLNNAAFYFSILKYHSKICMHASQHASIKLKLYCFQIDFKKTDAHMFASLLFYVFAKVQKDAF